MHITLAQTVAWVATLLGAWAIVRAGVAKGMIKLRPPVRCAACGRQKIRDRCPCTDDTRSVR
jgi:hypothetical protein